MQCFRPSGPCPCRKPNAIGLRQRAPRTGAKWSVRIHTHFRFAPKSRHRRTLLLCPLCANKRHSMRRTRGGKSLSPPSLPTSTGLQTKVSGRSVSEIGYRNFVGFLALPLIRSSCRRAGSDLVHRNMKLNSQELRARPSFSIGPLHARAGRPLISCPARTYCFRCP